MAKDAPDISYMGRSEAGSCNFCNRPHTKVYSITSSAPMGLTVRMCAKCRTELKRLP